MKSARRNSIGKFHFQLFAVFTIFFAVAAGTVTASAQVTTVPPLHGFGFREKHEASLLPA